jgi:hypothetical protein
MTILYVWALGVIILLLALYFLRVPPMNNDSPLSKYSTTEILDVLREEMDPRWWGEHAADSTDTIKDIEAKEKKLDQHTLWAQTIKDPYLREAMLTRIATARYQNKEALRDRKMRQSVKEIIKSTPPFDTK